MLIVSLGDNLHEMLHKRLSLETKNTQKTKNRRLGFILIDFSYTAEWAQLK